MCFRWHILRSYRFVAKVTFNVHYKDWLTYAGGTDRPGKIFYNFSILKDITQMVYLNPWLRLRQSCSFECISFFCR